MSRVVRDFASDIRTAHHVDYADSDETNRFHVELDRINRSLRSAQIDFIDDGGPRVEIGRRLLRRIFNTPDDHPRFDLGGRLYGGWWQDIERSRRGNIRIDGRQIAYLDFSSMFLRLAYARASLQAPLGDLYAGILRTELEGRYREGLKVVVNAMLFRSTPLQRLPKGSTELLPKGCTAASVRAAILRRHAPIREQFEAGVGLSLMKLESDILIAILLRLIDLGIVALPVYDALLIRHDVAEQVASVMRYEAKAQSGFELLVKAITSTTNR